jgi:linoleoyl-CoA desaturase
MRLLYKDVPDVLLLKLSAEVNKYFVLNKIDQYMNKMMIVKLIVMLFSLLFFYLAIYFFYPNFHLALISGFLYGLFTFFVAFNLAHDAGHNAVFRSKKYNRILLYLLNLIGVSSYIFQSKHNRHHFGPNISGSDADIDDFKIGRLVKDSKKSFIFRFQSFYLPIAYLFYYFAWVTYKDILAFKTIRNPDGKSLIHPRNEVVNLILTKFFIVGLHVFAPLILLGLNWQQLFMLNVSIYLAPGLMMLFFVIPVHLNLKTKFPLPDINNRLPYSWSEHQVLTTLDYSTQHPIINFFMGGFNHHVVHHLFPHICHCHYPALTPLLKKVIEDSGVHYQCVSYYQLLPLHLSYLKKMGRL